MDTRQSKALRMGIGIAGGISLLGLALLGWALCTGRLSFATEHGLIIIWTIEVDKEAKLKRLHCWGWAKGSYQAFRIERGGLGLLESFQDYPVYIDSHLVDDEEFMGIDLFETDYRTPIEGETSQESYPFFQLAKFKFAGGGEALGFIGWASAEELQSESRVLSHLPYIFRNSKETISLWEGNVYQFGDEYMVKGFQQLSEMAGGPDKIFPITCTSHQTGWMENVEFTVPGIGYYSAEDVVSFYQGPKAE